MEANWLVLQAESSDEYGCLWMAATPFLKLEDAKAFLKKVVNEEWGPIVLEFPDGSIVEKGLGDMPGYKSPSSSSIKHSHVYFDEDGTEAWDILGNVEKKIKIVQSTKEGERTC